MSNSVVKSLFVAALAVSALSGSLAQDPPPALQLGGRLPGLVLGGGLEGPKLRQLLTRPDVQRGLDLDLRQKNAITELFSDPNSGRIAVRLEESGPTSEEDRRRAIEDQVRAQAGGLSDKVQKILKPDQFDRLMQLDLQWRGALALAEPKVAEKLKIEPAHRQEIEKAASEYRQQKGEVMQKLMEHNDDGAGRVTVKLNTKELDNAASPPAKQLARAKAEAEKKILAALSAEERARWNKALGEPFVFRVDIPGNRF